MAPEPQDIPPCPDIEALLIETDEAFPVRCDFNVRTDLIGRGWTSEAQDVTHMLRGLTWKEVHLEEAVWLASSLSFFAPRAFCYYLPTFLTYAFTDMGRLYIMGSLEFALRPPEWCNFKEQDDENTRNWVQKWECITDKQSKTIISYLEYMTWYESPENLSDNAFEALTWYWYHRDGKIHWDT